MLVSGWLVVVALAAPRWLGGFRPRPDGAAGARNLGDPHTGSHAGSEVSTSWHLKLGMEMVHEQHHSQFSPTLHWDPIFFVVDLTLRNGR